MRRRGCSNQRRTRAFQTLDLCQRKQGLALCGDGLRPIAQLVFAKREYIRRCLSTRQHKKDPNTWKIGPSSKRTWIDLAQKRSAPNRGTPTRKREKYELEYTLRGMHTEDYKHQKGYVLRYKWRNYMRRRDTRKKLYTKGTFLRLEESIENEVLTQWRLSTISLREDRGTAELVSGAATYFTLRLLRIYIRICYERRSALPWVWTLCLFFLTWGLVACTYRVDSSAG